MTPPATATITGLCVRCETAEVQREVALGWLGAVASKLPLVCNECITNDDIERGAKAKAAAEVEARDHAEVRLLRSGLPAAHWHITLDELTHPQPIVDAARHWARDGRGLLLTGPVGAGKTTIAGAAALEMLKTRPLTWTSAPLLFARLGSGFDTEQRAWALEVLAGGNALVLDDIDKARPTEYGAEQMFLAVDQRVENRLPLLVTSNLGAGELAGRWPSPYSEAIASRLVGYCKIVSIEGNDRRLT